MWALTTQAPLNYVQLPEQLVRKAFTANIAFGYDEWVRLDRNRANEKVYERRAKNSGEESGKPTSARLYPL